MSIRSITPRKGLSVCAGPCPTGSSIATGLPPKPRLDVVEDRFKIGTFAIHLVDEHDSRDVVAIGLSPNRFALRFDTFAREKTTTAPSKHSQATFDFGGEVDVARCVEQVDVEVVPMKFHASAEDRDAPFLFFGVVVGIGRAMIDSADSVFRAAQEQHPFGDRRLARINVGDDADVAKFGDVGGHGIVCQCAVVVKSANRSPSGELGSRARIGQCGADAKRLSLSGWATDDLVAFSELTARLPEGA